MFAAYNECTKKKVSSKGVKIGRRYYPGEDDQITENECVFPILGLQILEDRGPCVQDGDAPEIDSRREMEKKFVIVTKQYHSWFH